MDIEEIKKYSKNKIEADDLIKQVRQRIKETTWEKQNLREGFTETFRPLISQFEDPGKDSKTQNIFTQNQKMLQNQLALTEGLKANQKAITDGFSQFERLADMQELPGIGAIEYGEDDKDDQARAPLPKEDKTQAPLPKVDKTQATLPKEDKTQAPLPKVDKTQATLPKEDKAQITITKDYFDRFLLDKKSQDTLIENGFDINPSYYFDKNTNIKELDNLINNVKSDLGGLHEELKNIASFPINEKGYLIAVSTATKKGPTLKTQEKIETFNIISVYLKNLIDLLEFRNQTGYGMFYSNPEELLHRFELLYGSLVAGNNGVLPEYIQIAHRLRDLGILSKNQLNTLLRKVI